jgi:tRNA (cmo5U34)-methyltransferase
MTPATFPGEPSHFDRAAERWDSPERAERAARIFRDFEDAGWAEPGQVVMDFGCGTGLFTLQLAKAAARVVAADRSRGMLDALNRKLVDGAIRNVSPLLVGDSFDLFELDAPLDGIFTAMTLHHVDDPPALFRAFHRHLRPGGWLCVIDLDEEDGSFHGDPETAGVRHFGFRREALEEALRSAGFAVRGYGNTLPIEKETAAGPRTFPVFLLIAERLPAA